MYNTYATIVIVETPIPISGFREFLAEVPAVEFKSLCTTVRGLKSGIFLRVYT